MPQSIHIPEGKRIQFRKVIRSVKPSFFIYRFLIFEVTKLKSILLVKVTPINQAWVHWVLIKGRRRLARGTSPANGSLHENIRPLQPTVYLPHRLAADQWQDSSGSASQMIPAVLVLRSKVTWNNIHSSITAWFTEKPNTSIAHRYSGFQPTSDPFLVWNYLFRKIIQPFWPCWDAGQDLQ